MADNGALCHIYGVPLSYGITECYLPPDTSEHTPPNRLLLDLPTPERWKAELT